MPLNIKGSGLTILAGLAIIASSVVYVLKGAVPDFLSGAVLLSLGGAAGGHIPQGIDPSPPVVTYVPPTAQLP